jgi:proteasome lid subunit RPN8/RPN11
MSRLLLPAAVRAELDALVIRGYPYETCGLVIGRQEPVGVQICRVVQARNLNVERAADRYLLDPEDFLVADREARAEGLEIVGIWHSHPDHPARPSETDRQGAWEGWSYVIVAVTRNGVADLRSWRLEGGAFVEEPITS